MSDVALDYQIHIYQKFFDDKAGPDKALYEKMRKVIFFQPRNFSESANSNFFVKSEKIFWVSEFEFSEMFLPILTDQK